MPKWMSIWAIKKNDNAGDNSGNSRNGYTTKTVITEDNDTIEIQVPRDRNSTFEPVIIPKHEKRTPLFNDQIISMYSFGMSTRDIQRHLQQVYGVEVSPPIRRFVPVDILFFYPGKSSLIFC